MPLRTLVEQAFLPIRTALDAGRIPGAVLGVVDLAETRGVALGGFAQLVPGRVPLARETVFDLASLTKVMVTTTQILRLVEDGLVDLDDPIGKHLPELRQDAPDAAIRGFTIRQMLTHQTGLIWHDTIYLWDGDPATLKAKVLQHDWPIGEKVYSDINFILLGLLIERKRSQPLDALPLPHGLTFRPNPHVTAATEQCPWRGRMLRGEVHDENAFALGGAAGHAGLFGTVDAVLTFAQALMTGKILRPATIEEMRRSQFGNRVLGWEKRFPGWAGGALCSAETIGHTGFTGTGLWLDFGRGYAWTLLTNRVHPSRDADSGIMDLRRAVGNILAALMSPGGRSGSAR